MLEASKLTKELKTIAPNKWQGSFIIQLRFSTSLEFLKEKVTTQKAKFRQLLTTKYAEYWKQGGDKYLDYLFGVMSSGASRARELNEALHKNDSEMPPLWFEFLEKSKSYLGFFTHFYKIWIELFLTAQRELEKIRHLILISHIRKNGSKT